MACSTAARAWCSLWMMSRVFIGLFLSSLCWRSMGADPQPLVELTAIVVQGFAGARIDDAPAFENQRLAGQRQDLMGMLLDQDDRHAAGSDHAADDAQEI